jgi:hypothetical protein
VRFHDGRESLPPDPRQKPLSFGGGRAAAAR